MPVVKRIPAKESGDLKARADYIRDAAHAAPGETYGPKVACAGVLNGDGDDWHAALFGMLTKEAIFETSGEKSEHWVASLREGEVWTKETAPVFAATLQRHLGYEGPALWSVHFDTKNSHLHMAFSRIREDEAGKLSLAISGGSECHPVSGHTYTHLSAAKAEAEIRALQGWSREKRAVYDFKDGKFVKAEYPKSDPDKIRLGSRVEAYEAHHQKPHPKRILAETAMAEIRAVPGENKPEATLRLAAAGITVVETDRGVKLVTADVPKGLKLSALPKDCRWIGNSVVPGKAPKKEPDTTTHSGTKAYVKRCIKDSDTEPIFLQKLEEKGLVFEQTGKNGARVRFGDGPADVVKMSECGVSLPKLREKFAAAAVPGAVPVYAPVVEVPAKIPGAVPVYAPVAEASPGGAPGALPIYAPIMPDTQDKINALSDKVHGNMHESSIITDAPAILLSGETKEKMLESLAAQDISLTVETGTDRKTGKSFQYGKLSRPGEKPVSLRQLGLSPEGRPLFSLPSLEYGWKQAERKERQNALRSEAIPLITAQASAGWDAAVAECAFYGIRLTEEPTIIKDKDTGQQKEVIVARLEKDGVTVNLRSLTGDDDKPLFSSRVLQRQQLASDAARVFEDSKSWSEAEQIFAERGSAYRREKITIQDKETGQEKTVVVGRIERDGITITTGQIGPEFAISKLDARYLPYQDARNLYEQARLQASPVSFLAAQGLTVSDIDRIGRVGERAEKALQRKEKPSKAAPAAPVRPVGKSVIPTSLREILDLIEESAQQAAQLARANAAAARSAVLADRAERRAEVAEAALAEIKASIPVQEKPKPKTEAPAEKPEKEITMSDTNTTGGEGGAALAPESPKKKGWLAAHAEEALAAAHDFAATSSPSGGSRAGQEDEQHQTGPTHGPRQ